MKKYTVIVSEEAIEDNCFQYDFIQRNYGPNARHIIYKKMAIIYTVFDDTAYVIRIIAGSLIH
ncbi:MAG: hypothetical protein LBC98_09405 [Prevotellaceae bacterium]|jgi:hypothetical protein|nr:hypothetical protein [Prevotellaceae bacterium]